MKHGEVIWIKDSLDKDVYAEFLSSFVYFNGKKITIKIACSSHYALFVNDRIVSFSHCSDFPFFKYYNEIEIDKYTRRGPNKISINVWHEGIDTQRSINDKPGLFFEIFENDLLIDCSGEHTLCRLMEEYQNNYCKLITPQLGYSFCYNNNPVVKKYDYAILTNNSYSLHKRPIKELILKERNPIVISRVEDGYLIDLQNEMAGFIEFNFECLHSERITVGYGEHIIDGTVRQKIGPRDFSVEFISKPGKNNYINYFRRIAGRYLHVTAKNIIKINYIGVRDVEYPLKVNSFDFNDDFMNKVYETSIRTLRLCMHEHYEDCPWREQCLYTMDSFNQIRCGYYCFEDGNKDYVRYNLSLISKSIRNDNLLCICAPSGLDYPIPSFSLAFLLEVSEYLDFSKDYDFKEEVSDTIYRIVEAFTNRIDDNHLIPSFGKPYWDFYEWQDHCAGGEIEEYSSILNMLFVFAIEKSNKHFNFNIDLTNIKKAINKMFIEDNIVYLNEKKQFSSQLSCALGILINLCDDKTAKEMLNSNRIIQATLSMKSFVYDSLLKLDGDKYKDFILDDIKKNYSIMLEDGATSFYETIKGAEDFDGAGSLCHGWSAIPIYYYNMILK